MRLKKMRKEMILVASLLLMFSSIAVAGRMYGSTLCKQAGYHCLKVKRNQSWRSLWPDDHDRDIVMRVNRMNTQLYQGLTIAVPDHLETSDIMDFAPFPKQIQSNGEKVVVVDPRQYAWGAYDQTGTLVRWGPASAGSDWCKDLDEPCHTHEGVFRVFVMGNSSCYSTKFPLPDGGAPMPYCMYFNNGQALHGEPNGLPGYNASHGCVRLYVNDAEWLRYDFIDGPNAYNNYRGTTVDVLPYATDPDSTPNEEKKIKKARQSTDDSDPYYADPYNDSGDDSDSNSDPSYPDV